MAAVKIKDYSNGVMVIANDLLTGRTVFFSQENTWLALAGLEHSQAAIAHSEAEAESLLGRAVPTDGVSPVIDAYVIELDANGLPSHSRERLRASGPSIQYGQQVGASHVPVH